MRAAGVRSSAADRIDASTSLLLRRALPARVGEAKAREDRGERARSLHRRDLSDRRTRVRDRDVHATTWSTAQVRLRFMPGDRETAARAEGRDVRIRSHSATISACASASHVRAADTSSRRRSTRYRTRLRVEGSLPSTRRSARRRRRARAADSSARFMRAATTARTSRGLATDATRSSSDRPCFSE